MLFGIVVNMVMKGERSKRQLSQIHYGSLRAGSLFGGNVNSALFERRRRDPASAETVFERRKRDCPRIESLLAGYHYGGLFTSINFQLIIN